MRKLTFLKALSLGFIISAAPVVWAQEGTGQRSEGNRQLEPGQNRSGGDNNRQGTTAGGATQGTTTQSGARGNQTPGSSASGSDTSTQQSGDARGGNAMNRANQGQNALQSLVVGKLIKGNEAEIELAQMAQQRAEHQQVKDFAKMMIDDHTKVKDRLTSLKTQEQDGASELSGSTGASGGNRGSAGNQDQSDSSRAGGGANSGGQRDRQERNSTGGQSGASQSGAGQSGASQSGAGQSGASQSGAGQSGAGQSGTAQGSGQQGETQMRRGGANNPMTRLASIMDEACENNLQMTKEMLGQYKGQEFDMAYIGQQIVAHTHMLAELKALDGVGGQELQQIVREAQTSTQQHLDHAKQIATQLKQEKKS